MQSNNDKWDVGFDGQSYGPYPFETLRLEAAAGRMPREAFVWAPGMEGWKAAGEVQGLFETPPSNPRAAQVMVPQLNSGKPLGSDDLARQQEEPTKEPDLQLAGAWRRFFARSIDLWLTALASVFLGAMVLGLTSPAFSIWMQDPTSAGIFAWMMFPIAMVADAAVVAVFGNSLGKALLGV